MLENLCQAVYKCMKCYQKFLKNHFKSCEILCSTIYFYAHEMVVMNIRQELIAYMKQFWLQARSTFPQNFFLTYSLKAILVWSVVCGLYTLEKKMA